MIKNILSKIWKDPVWSKIIAAGILALISIIYGLITSKYLDISFISSFYIFWNLKIPFWGCIFLLFLLGFLFYYSNRNFKYDNETIEIDRKLFEQIRNKDGMLNLILDIKSNRFSSASVKFDRISTLIDLLDESQNPDYEFINPKLDKLKIKLIGELEMLNSVLSNYIFSNYNGEWLSIPSEWEYNHPERMWKAKKEIKIQEDIVTKTYQNFISKGRQLLKV